MQGTRVSSAENDKSVATAAPKLAYLVSQYPAVNHAFMLREIRELRRRGFVVEIASISPPDRTPERMTDEEREEAAQTFYVKSQPIVNVLGTHVSAFLSRPAKYLGGLLFALGLARGGVRKLAYQFLYFAEAVVVGEWMRRRGMTHVHVHYSTTVVLIASHIFPITISATMHGPDEFSDPEGSHLRKKIEVCKFVCAISDFGRSQLMRYCYYSDWQKLHVVRLGVDTENLRPSDSRSEPGPFRFLTAGRLAPVKGQHILLDAMAKVQSGRCDFVLHIAGDGPDRQDLEAHASRLGIGDRVIFEGFVNQDQLGLLYRKADAFVLPSFAEGLPVVLMEAMALGVPCISTWVNGVPELIRDGIDGLTVAPGDSDALAWAISYLIDKPEHREELARAGRKRAVEVVDLRTNVSRLAELFTEHLSMQPSMKAFGSSRV